jgi:long-chain acyl-CoA synthetase
LKLEWEKTMSFYDVPLLVESNPQENATDLLLERVAKNPKHPLFSRQNPDKTWRDVTSADFLAEVKTLAKGLIAAGIKPGQAVAIMSKTRYEWSMIDFAIWFSGCLLYTSPSPRD